MSNTIDDVIGLTREGCFEAALFLRDQLQSGPLDDPGLESLLQKISAEPFKYVDDIDGLTRMLLIAASDDAALRDEVTSAVRATGRKAFVFGGAEIVALATLAVFALKLYYTKGVSERNVEYEIEESPDGKRIVRFRGKVVYGLGGDIGTVVGKYLGSGK